MTLEQFERLQQILQALEPETKNMRGRSPDFVRDQLERVDRFGVNVSVTPRQMTWLEDLYVEHVGSLDALGGAAPTDAENREDVLGEDPEDDEDPAPKRPVNTLEWGKK